MDTDKCIQKDHNLKSHLCRWFSNKYALDLNLDYMLLRILDKELVTYV